MDEVGEDWPLIRLLMDDPVYADRYHQELQTQLAGTFDLDHLRQLATAHHELVVPYAIGAEGEQAPYTHIRSDHAFETSVEHVLLVAAERRHDEADDLQTE